MLEKLLSIKKLAAVVAIALAGASVSCEGPTAPDKSDKGVRTYCLPEQRNAEFCIAVYMPVCGWNGPKTKGLKYPYASDYTNPCLACSVPTVAYWTPGRCPK
ncbi:hypothetical protein JW711_01475 [Candidatus Woesearchaeota archaeon]|nr:hypothetical protein [Candidatus Woesearchaeota archaeon]